MNSNNINNVESQYCRLFKTLKEVGPASNFESKVCALVKQRKAKELKMRLFCFSAVALSSCVATIYSAMLFARSFFSSGFSEYLSLVLSADSSLMAFWKEIAYSLVESVPVGALVSVLAASVLFLWSLARVSKNAGAISSSRITAAVF